MKGATTKQRFIYDLLNKNNKLLVVDSFNCMSHNHWYISTTDAKGDTSSGGKNNLLLATPSFYDVNHIERVPLAHVP